MCNDMIDWSKQYEFVEKIGIRGYRRKYSKEYGYIWDNFVPKSGQADTLQGELLRQSAKLWSEAIRNGNINWNNDFTWFCDFLKETLTKSDIFDNERKEKISQCLDYIKENGEYARKVNKGLIEDKDVDILKLAYTRDDLYYYIEDAIVEYYIKNPEPIPYEKKDFIKR